MEKRQKGGISEKIETAAALSKPLVVLYLFDYRGFSLVYGGETGILPIASNTQ
jgi:hypothetical protein